MVCFHMLQPLLQAADGMVAEQLRRAPCGWHARNAPRPLASAIRRRRNGRIVTVVSKGCAAWAPRRRSAIC